MMLLFQETAMLMAHVEWMQGQKLAEVKDLYMIEVYSWN